MGQQVSFERDFWRKEQANRSTTRFVQVVERYREYAQAHRDHTFITTIEGLSTLRHLTTLTFGELDGANVFLTGGAGVGK